MLLPAPITPLPPAPLASLSPALCVRQPLLRRFHLFAHWLPPVLLVLPPRYPLLQIHDDLLCHPSFLRAAAAADAVVFFSALVLSTTLTSGTVRSSACSALVSATLAGRKQATVTSFPRVPVSIETGGPLPEKLGAEHLDCPLVLLGSRCRLRATFSKSLGAPSARGPHGQHHLTPPEIRRPELSSSSSVAVVPKVTLMPHLAHAFAANSFGDPRKNPLLGMPAARQQSNAACVLLRSRMPSTQIHGLPSGP